MKPLHVKALLLGTAAGVGGLLPDYGVMPEVRLVNALCAGAFAAFIYSIVNMLGVAIQRSGVRGAMVAGAVAVWGLIIVALAKLERKELGPPEQLNQQVQRRMDKPNNQTVEATSNLWTVSRQQTRSDTSARVAAGTPYPDLVWICHCSSEYESAIKTASALLRACGIVPNLKGGITGLDISGHKRVANAAFEILKEATDRGELVGLELRFKPMDPEKEK